MCSVTALHAQHPGFDSHCLHNCRDWCLSPVSLLLGVSITWLSLKWLVAAFVLEAEWSRIWEIPLVLTTWNCGIAQGSGDTRPRIILTRLPLQNYHFNAHQRGMKGASQTVSCLPQMETFKL